MFCLLIITFLLIELVEGVDWLFYRKKSINCNITNYSTTHIDIQVIDEIKGKWRLTGFYGMQEGRKRKESWNLLRRLSQMSSLPWCIMGDFNDILSMDEKKGMSERPNWLMQG